MIVTNFVFGAALHFLQVQDLMQVYHGTVHSYVWVLVGDVSVR